MMTLNSLLILLSLCTCIFSNSLSNFRQVAGEEISYVDLVREIENDLVVHKVKKYPYFTEFDGSVESCAEQCSEMKFYCHSFMVMYFDKGSSKEFKCIMTDEQLNNLESYFARGPGSLRNGNLKAAYEREEEIDNVAEILTQPNLLRKGGYRALLELYGATEDLVGGNEVNDLKAFVKGCEAALNVPDSKPTNFKEWLNEEESPEQPKSGSTPKYTSNNEPTTKRRKINPSIPRIKSKIPISNSNIPGVDILTFLDLLSRGVDSRIQTIYDPIYDPEKGILYIDSPDTHLLITVYQNGEYVYAVFGDGFKKVQVGGSEARTTGDGLNTVIADFVEAARRFGHSLENIEVKLSATEDKFDDHQIWRFAGFLIRPLMRYKQRYHFLLGKDLSKVVPILREKRASPLTEEVRTFVPFGDVQVITVNKDVES